MSALPRGRFRRAVSVTSAVAVVLVVTVGAGVVFLYPSLSGAGGNRTTGTTTNPVNATDTITITSYTTYLPPTTSTTTITTSSQTGWQAWAVANATLGYYKTQNYIRNAWNYTFNILQSGTNPPHNETFVSNIIGVLGMIVSGNWTTGYTLTFSPSELNVTVQYTPPSTYYPVIFFSSHNGTDFQQTIQFNSTQQNAISIALANSTVKSALTQYPYFVDDSFRFPSGNSTFGGDYLVWFFQSNGPKILGVFVNMNLGTVASQYTDTRVTKTCYSNSICWSSPWGY